MQPLEAWPAARRCRTACRNCAACGERRRRQCACAVTTTIGSPGYFAASRCIASPSAPPGTRRSTMRGERAHAEPLGLEHRGGGDGREAALAQRLGQVVGERDVVLDERDHARRAAPRPSSSSRRGIGTGFGSTATRPSRARRLQLVVGGVGGDDDGRQRRIERGERDAPARRRSSRACACRRRARRSAARATSASARSPESTATASASPLSPMISARFSAKATLSSTMRYLRMRTADGQPHDEARAGALAAARRRRRRRGASTMRRTSARPRPMPLALVVMSGSNSRRRVSASTPGPESSTATSTSPPSTRPRDATSFPSGPAACTRVLDEVHEHLAELQRVAVDRRQRVHAVDRPARRRQRQRAEHAGERVVERRPSRAAAAVADHVEQRRDDAVGHAELLADAPDVLLGALVVADALTRGCRATTR